MIKKLLRLLMPKQNNYVGEMDRFLMEFDRVNPALSLSQRRLKQKCKKIFKQRDRVTPH